MAQHFTALILLLSIAASPSQVSAIEGAQVEMGFKVFGIGKDSFEGLYYQNEGKYFSIRFHKTSRSVASYKYAGTSPIMFYVKNPAFSPAEPNSLEFLPVTSCAISEPIQDCLIIFSAHPNNRTAPDTDRSFNLFALDDSVSTFGHNSMVILNTTGAQLLGKINNNRMILNAGLSKPIQYSNKSNSKSATKIAFALQTKDGVRLVMSNDVKLPTDRRIVLILEPPKQAGSMRISARILSESIYLNPEEAE